MTAGQPHRCGRLRAAIAPTDEQNAVQRTSLAVGGGMLLVPAGTSLFAY